MASFCVVVYVHLQASGPRQNLQARLIVTVAQLVIALTSSQAPQKCQQCGLVVGVELETEDVAADRARGGAGRIPPL